MSHDYQNEMSLDTRSVDTAGEQAAEATEAETVPVGEKTVTTKKGNATYSRTVGTFGVLPAVEIPIEFARERLAYFQELAIITGSSSNLFTDSRGTNSAAHKSQAKLAEAYMNDIGHLTKARTSYDMLVPLARMAAKAFAKTHEVGQHLGVSDVKGPALGAKHQRALNGAARALHSPLDEFGSLAARSAEMIEARHRMNAANAHLTTVVENFTVVQLRKKYARASARTAEIQKKIEKAKKAVKHVASAAALIAGGAGLAAGVGVVADAAGSEEQTRSTAASVEAIGKGVKSHAGVVETAVGFGMGLYHEQELLRLEVTMTVVRGILDEHERAKAEATIDAAFGNFHAAQLNYANCVRAFSASVNDRRKTMAVLGRLADRRVAPSSRASNASDAMLWVATVMETQAFLTTALDTGTQTEKIVNDATKEVRETRNLQWGLRSDVAGSDNLPRIEGERGPDIVALKRTQHLVSRWMQGAREVDSRVERVAETQGKPVLEMVGYTHDY